MRKTLVASWLVIVLLFCSLAGLAESAETAEPTEMYDYSASHDVYFDFLDRVVTAPPGWVEGYMSEDVEQKSIALFIAPGEDSDDMSAAKGAIFIYRFDDPTVMETVAAWSMEEFGLTSMEIVRRSIGGTDMSLSASYDLSDDTRHVRVATLVGRLQSGPKIFMHYQFPTADGLMLRVVFAIPADGSLDAAWFTDALTEDFPRMAEVTLPEQQDVDALTASLEPQTAADLAASTVPVEDLKYEISKEFDAFPEGAVLINGYKTEPVGRLVIPAELEGYPVIGVDSEAFSGCTGLTSMALPNSVMYLGPYAFYGCPGAVLTIPRSVVLLNSALDYQATMVVEKGSFADLYAKYNYFPNVFYDIADALPGTLDLSGAWRYTLEDGGAKIVRFGELKPVGEIAFPDALDGHPVTAIGDKAFEYCMGLTGVTVPDSVVTLGSNVFGGCTALTEVSIGDGVTSIGESAFYNCQSLGSVSLGSSVETIGGYAFAYNEKLASVTLPASLTKIGDGAFTDHNKKLTFHVQRGSYAARYAKLEDIPYVYEPSDVLAAWVPAMTDDEISGILGSMDAGSPVEVTAAFVSNPAEAYWGLAQEGVPLAPVLRYFEEQGGLTKPKAKEDTVSFTVAKDAAEQWADPKAVAVTVEGLDAKALTAPAGSLLPLVQALEEQWSAPSELAAAFAENPQEAWWNLAGESVSAAPIFRYFDRFGLTKPKAAKDKATFSIDKDYAEQWYGRKTLEVPAAWADAKTFAIAPGDMLALVEAIAAEWTLPPAPAVADVAAAIEALNKNSPALHVEYVDMTTTQSQSGAEWHGLQLNVNHRGKQGAYSLTAPLYASQHQRWNGSYWAKGQKEQYWMWGEEEPSSGEMDEWSQERYETLGFPYFSFTYDDLALQEEGVPIAGRPAKHYSGEAEHYDYHTETTQWLPFQMWIDEEFGIPLKYLLLQADGETPQDMMEITALAFEDTDFPTLEEAIAVGADLETRAKEEAGQWKEAFPSLWDGPTYDAFTGMDYAGWDGSGEDAYAGDTYAGDAYAGDAYAGGPPRSGPLEVDSLPFALATSADDIQTLDALEAQADVAVPLGSDLITPEETMRDQFPYLHVEYIQDMYVSSDGVGYQKLQTCTEHRSEEGIYFTFTFLDEPLPAYFSYWDATQDYQYLLWAGSHSGAMEPLTAEDREGYTAYGALPYYEMACMAGPMYLMEEDVSIAGRSTKCYLGRLDDLLYRVWIDDEYGFPMKYEMLTADGSILNEYMEITALEFGDTGLPPLEALGYNLDEFSIEDNR